MMGGLILPNVKNVSSADDTFFEKVLLKGRRADKIYQLEYYEKNLVSLVRY